MELKAENNPGRKRPDVTAQPDDDVLYGAFLSGDTASFDSLMIRYGDRLWGYLNGLLDNREDAEDLMIEAFARIMAARPRIGQGNFKAYLFRTARNIAVRHIQKERRLRTFDLDEAEAVSDDLLPEERLMEDDQRSVMHRCLTRIDPELREAMWLVYAEELSYAEAAQVMKVRVKKVDNLLAKGKIKLREELKKEGIQSAYG